MPVGKGTHMIYKLTWYVHGNAAGMCAFATVPWSTTPLTYGIEGVPHSWTAHILF